MSEWLAAGRSNSVTPRSSVERFDYVVVAAGHYTHEVELTLPAATCSGARIITERVISQNLGVFDHS
jgi:glycine/D-amino acid oxidase-like deaminating enzyme